MFQDEVRLKVAAGRGGDGAVAFHREKWVPKGGPSGGDGGKGGDIIIVASEDVHGFFDLRGRRVVRAKPGQQGGAKQRYGKDGEDLEIRVPVGTQIRDAASKVLLKDLTTNGASVILAKGGKGGRGNARFGRSTRQTPRFAESGDEGETRDVILTLKLIADAGLVGLPNAGKSTLLASLSRSRTKVGGYQFTTLAPHLGVVEVDATLAMTFADLPGLVEGAHEGRGLGIRFLQHVERTRLLVHIVAHDPTGASPKPADAWRTVREELRLYSPELAEKPEILVLSKCDLPGHEKALRSLAKAADAEVFPVSAATGMGLPALLRKVAQTLTAG